MDAALNRAFSEFREAQAAGPPGPPNRPVRPRAQAFRTWTADRVQDGVERGRRRGLRQHFFRRQSANLRRLGGDVGRALLLIAAWSAVRAVCMLVRTVASAVCSVVKYSVAELLGRGQVQQLGEPATWLATIWAVVGGVGVVPCALANMVVKNSP
jgi:hypothetical protein